MRVKDGLLNMTKTVNALTHTKELSGLDMKTPLRCKLKWIGLRRKVTQEQ